MCTSGLGTDCRVRGQPSASASVSQGRCTSGTVSVMRTQLSQRLHTDPEESGRSASFIDYQMICASVPHPVRAHRAADRRLSCVFNLDASTVAYCCSINTPSSGITGNTAGMSLHEPLTVTALLK